MILSKTFDMWDKTRTGLYFSLPKSSFSLNIGLTSAAFKSCGKQSFLKDKFAIFVRIETSISIVDFNIPAGISPTGMNFVPANLKISYQTLFSVTSCKENLSGVFSKYFDDNEIFWAYHPHWLGYQKEFHYLFLNPNLLLYSQNICSPRRLKLQHKNLRHLYLLALVYWSPDLHY